MTTSAAGPVQLPPPSPALELHQAAATLRAMAAKARKEMASNDYWDMGWARGITNAVGGTQGELAALLSPDMADPWADWLDRTAVGLVCTTHPDWQATVAADVLAVARLINGTAGGA